VTEWVSGSLYIRAMGEGGMGLKKGEVVGGHLHRFDHTTICFCGNWHVTKWEPGGAVAFDFEREGPFHVLIEKDCLHEFTFLGGAPIGHAWCVYSHRYPQGDVSLEYTGWLNAYEQAPA
jgi:hypothetical protein